MRPAARLSVLCNAVFRAAGLLRVFVFFSALLVITLLIGINVYIKVRKPKAAEKEDAK